MYASLHDGQSHPVPIRLLREPSVDWGRKHMCDIAHTCGACAADTGIAAAQRGTFAEIYAAIKHDARLPSGGGWKRIGRAVVALCGACRGAELHSCSGRTVLQQPCRLVQQRTR